MVSSQPCKNTSLSQAPRHRALSGRGVRIALRRSGGEGADVASAIWWHHCRETAAWSFWRHATKWIHAQAENLLDINEFSDSPDYLIGTFTDWRPPTYAHWLNSGWWCVRNIQTAPALPDEWSQSSAQHTCHETVRQFTIYWNQTASKTLALRGWLDRLDNENQNK